MSVPARADCMVSGVVAEVVHNVCLSADGWGAKAAKQCRPPPCGIVHRRMPCGVKPRWPRVGDRITRAAQTIPRRIVEPLHDAGIARGRPGYIITTELWVYAERCGDKIP